MKPGELSTRQREVIRLIGQGLTDKEIARRLKIGEGTVSNHVRLILARLQARSRAHAVSRWLT